MKNLQLNVTETRRPCSDVYRSVRERHSLHKLLAVFTALVAGIACENAPPEIKTLQVQLSYVYDTVVQSAHEELVVWLTADDPDGVEQLSEVYIIHDKSQHYWRLLKGEWIQEETRGRFLIGAIRLTRADLSPLPRGRYRLMLIDVAQQKAERIFSLSDGPKDVLQYIPRLSISSSSITLESPFLLNYTYVLSEEGLADGFEVIASGRITRSLSSPLPRYLLSRYRNRIFISGPYYIP